MQDRRHEDTEREHERAYQVQPNRRERRVARSVEATHSVRQKGCTVHLEKQWSNGPGPQVDGDIRDNQLRKRQTARSHALSYQIHLQTSGCVGKQPRTIRLTIGCTR